MTAMTPAERQAAFKARKDEAIVSMSASVEALIRENADLRTRLDTMTERCHAAELKAITAELKFAKAKK